MGQVQTGIVRFGRAAVTLTTDVTLTSAEQKCRHLEFGGTPAGACIVTLYEVSDGQEWVLYNNTGQNVTLKASGATGVLVATARSAILRCNATDVVRVTADSVIT